MARSGVFGRWWIDLSGEASLEPPTVKQEPLIPAGGELLQRMTRDTVGKPPDCCKPYGPS